MYYIKAKHQKKKEEIHFIYAFPQIFYKKFTFLCLYIVHKFFQCRLPAPILHAVLLLLPVNRRHSAAEHRLEEEMSQAAEWSPLGKTLS